MPWVRFDDQYPIHRKVNGLSDAAFRLHTEAIFWCARNLTDGCIARDELRVASEISRPLKHVAELVSRGCWRETDDGWEIHDFLVYQPSRSKVLQTREERKKAGSAGGTASGESRRRSSQAPRSKREAKPKQVASDSLGPRTRSSLQEEGTDGAPLRGGGAPPSRQIKTTTGRLICETHQLEISNTVPCRGCAADFVAADVDEALDRQPPSRDDVRAQLAASRGMYKPKSTWQGPPPELQPDPQEA
jgi:hypothetical protein